MSAGCNVCFHSLVAVMCSAKFITCASMCMLREAWDLSKCVAPQAKLFVERSSPVREEQRQHQHKCNKGSVRIWYVKKNSTLTVVTGSDVFPRPVGLRDRRIRGDHFSVQLLLQCIQAAQIQRWQRCELLFFSWCWWLVLQYLYPKSAFRA